MAEKYILGQKVDLIIERKTDLGFVATINDMDEGLLYHNEIFEQLDCGQRVPGFVKKLRADGGIDLILQPLGTKGAGELGENILAALKQANGFLPLNATTPAEKIHELFGVSKKKFKIALGGLYKRRLISITDEGVELVPLKESAKK